MGNRAFVSYRRTDAQQAAFGLVAQLSAKLGPTSVFMDRSGLSPGDVWPNRLREVLTDVTVVLALMGPNWLTAADQYGKRRLDLAGDWVRTEIVTALKAGKFVIPVLLPPVHEPPPKQALPANLRALTDRGAYTLRDDHWDADVNGLVHLLVNKYGFQEIDRQVRLPSPQVKAEPLSAAQIHAALRSMSGWESVESLVPADYPNTRQELRKAYTFKTFRAAIQFMSAAVDIVNSMKHHPRWENQWRTVTVHLSTWDIGNRISNIDFDLANQLDRLYDRLSHPVS